MANVDARSRCALRPSCKAGAAPEDRWTCPSVNLLDSHHDARVRPAPPCPHSPLSAPLPAARAIRDRPAARPGIPSLARRNAAARRRLDRGAGAAGATTLRRDLLSAHVELGYGARSLREVHAGYPFPFRRQGHPVPDAADRTAAGPLGRDPGQPARARRVRSADAGRVRPHTTSFVSRSHRKGRAATRPTGSQASTGLRAPSACRSRLRTSITRAAKSVSARTSISPVTSPPTWRGSGRSTRTSVDGVPENQGPVRLQDESPRAD